jgi:hypothetical protein
MQLSAPALAALKSSLADASKGWKLVSVHESTSETQLWTGSGLTMAFETVVRRHASLTIESADGRILIFMLEGLAGAPASSATLIYKGSSFDVTDAPLIALLESKIPAAAALFEGLLLEDLAR